MSGRLRRTDYPPHWGHLRALALARDNHCCACQGECGSAHTGRCAAPNHAMIMRDPGNPAHWWHADDAPRSPLLPSSPRIVQVILTIAHVCQESTCAELTHLRAMCQRCHLRYDAGQHAASAARTRQRQLGEGQYELFCREGV